MATSFDFTEFFVTQGASANTLNAGGPSLGTNDGPVETYGNCDAVIIGGGPSFTIENQDNTGWGSTAVDDFIRWDTGGVKEFAVVIDLNWGADADVIRVTVPRLNLTVGVGKTVRVGGAFDSAQDAADWIENVYIAPLAGGNPRINIKRHGGTPYVEAFDIDTWPGTSARPITFEGYNTIPGDIDPMTSTDRAKFEPNAAAIGAGTAVIYVNVAWIRLLNLDCETAVAGKYGIYVDDAGDNGVAINCRGKAPDRPAFRANAAAIAYTASRGLWEGPNTGLAVVDFYSGRGKFIDNIVHGGSGGNTPGVRYYGDRSVFEENHIYGNTGDGVLVVSNVFLGCHVAGNTIADNGGDGLDLAVETDLETNVITNNIIAHNGGWGIAGVPGSPHRFGLIDYNMIYGNATGAVQDIEAGGDLIDDSRHDDEANPPFTGADAAARAANFYELTVEARQIQQLFADDDFKTYPDAGASQVRVSSALGRGFLRGMA